MSKRTKQKLLHGCLAAAVVLSTSLTPMLVSAATPNGPNPVTRLGGVDQYATAALIAQNGWTGTSDSVVLSAGLNYSLVDALAAGPLAAKLKAPILLTDNGATLNPLAKAELVRLKPTKAYITSGTAVIKQTVLDEVQAMGITPVQLGGFDQYETSVNIAKEMANQGVKISQIMLAAGYLSPADALSAAPIAAAQGIPVLTTTQGQLPASVKVYLDSIKANITNSYVVGGTAVVADAVKAQLPGTVTRYAGQTKYDTNVQILKGLAKNYKNKTVYVANGETLVDALAGVPLAAANNAPVVLVNQQLADSTRDFVKSNMSTTDMVALGGEVVVPTAEMNTLTSATAYSTDSATLGSTDATKPLELTDNVLLTGKNTTLTNATADYSVYVKGDNINLNNITVKGTVFVDPGNTGSATLDGVKAGNIVILSGAANSIHIKNTTADVLTVDSSSNVHVDATGSTTIGNTVVRTFAIVDSDGGSLGQVTISSTPGQAPVVELRGTFTQPVVVEGAATITAAPGASIAQLTIAPQTANAQVTLGGNFTAVNVNAQASVVLAANATVSNMTTNAKADIQVPSTAKVTNLTDVGNTGTLVSGGGLVNGQTTTMTPSAPATGTTPPAGGGGGTLTSATISSFAILDNSNAHVGTASGTTVDLTSLANTQMINALQITASPTDSNLQLTGLVSTPTGTVTFSNKNFPLSSSITMANLLLNTIQNGDVSLGSLRTLFGSSVTFNGVLSHSGNTSSNVSLTLNLGVTAGVPLNNTWTVWTVMTVDSSTHVITATIKSGESSTKLSTMGISSLISPLGVLPVSVCTIGLNAVGPWDDPSTDAGKASIKAAIATLEGSGVTWLTATLGQLSGKTIYFKDQNTIHWTINFN